MPALRKYEIRCELKDTNLNKAFYKKKQKQKTRTFNCSLSPKIWERRKQDTKTFMWLMWLDFTHPSCFLLLAGEVEKLHSHFPEFIATWVWRKSGSTTEETPWGWEADPKAISLALLPVWAG